MIPTHSENGRLPVGIHRATIEEVRTRFATNARRTTLFEGMLDAIKLLKAAGCTRIYLDGSFVTTKERPGDFDAAYDTSGIDWGAIDEVLVTFDDGRAQQKARFHGELFPADSIEEGSGKTFLEFFQTDTETGEPKGIVEIILDDS